MLIRWCECDSLSTFSDGLVLRPDRLSITVITTRKDRWVDTRRRVQLSAGHAHNRPLTGFRYGKCPRRESDAFSLHSLGLVFSAVQLSTMARKWNARMALWLSSVNYSYPTIMRWHRISIMKSLKTHHAQKSIIQWWAVGGSVNYLAIYGLSIAY